MYAAQAIYDLTLGPQPPLSVSSFIHDVLTTDAGRQMIVIGIGGWLPVYRSDHGDQRRVVSAAARP